MKTYSKSWLAIAILTFVTLLVKIVASQPIYAAGPWYVTPSGDDSNSCLSPATPCATINGGIGKASSGDTIYVATGTYTNSTGSEVVLIDKDIILSGGWDAAFTSQSGMATIDGEGQRRGITVNDGSSVRLERFIIEGGSGGGVSNQGDLTLARVVVKNNLGSYFGGGIDNAGRLIIDRSAIISNIASGNGGGIAVHYNYSSIEPQLIMTNSTVSGNWAGIEGGGIFNDMQQIDLHNVTISGNQSPNYPGSGVANYGLQTAPPNFRLDNTLIYGNEGNECISLLYDDEWSTIAGGMLSIGDNLLASSCSEGAGVGDLLGVNPQLLPLAPEGYHPLAPNSPAIDAGECWLTRDQRETFRPLDGNNDGQALCDIGAYEFDPQNSPLPFLDWLPLIRR